MKKNYYTPPSIETIEIEIEGAMLSASPITNNSNSLPTVTDGSSAW